MQLQLTYCYDGSVPEVKGLYICIYIDPSGKPSLGLARAEYDIELNSYVWNAELAEVFGASPPLAYMEVKGNASALVAILEEKLVVNMGLLE